MTVPLAFANRMVRVHGDVGRRWIEGLPALIDEVARRWKIEVGPPVSNLSYNYAAPAFGVGGDRFVLKLGVGSAEGDREPVAMAAYGGRGAARLVRHDSSRHAMLLERVEPGDTLLNLAEEEAVAVAADVLQLLWKAPLPGTLPDLAEWTRSLDRFSSRDHPFPKPLFDRAHALRRELLAPAPASVLLHGDLHHTNVLRSEARGWLAIDPKGVVGEPAFDIVWFLLNPGPVPRKTTARRIAGFAERLGLERERIVAWALVGVMTSACWTVEEGGTDVARSIGFAEDLAER